MGSMSTMYSEDFKRAVVSDYESSGLSVREIKDKYGIGCVSTVKSWIGLYGILPYKTSPSVDRSNNKSGVKRVMAQDMVSRKQYDELKAEVKLLKQKVAEGCILRDVDKFRMESVVELFGKKQADALERLTKKKLY